MGCPTSVVKYRVFIFNFVIALAGLALLIVGILVERQIQICDEFLDEKFIAMPFIVIVIGCIIFIVSFFGCCGAIRESRCMLVTYVILVLTIFIIQVVVAGLAFAYTKDTKDNIHRKLKDYVENYDDNTVIVDHIQSYLECCGYDGSQDYSNRADVPSSCCENEDPCEQGSPDIYRKGCGQAFEDFLNGQGYIIGGVAIGIAVVEIVAIIFGLCLAISIKNEERGEIIEDS